ncbi:MAG: UDP-3-O-acyl-N-acetylglucosamine deacetylase [Kiritimatiellae bacterium]|nr:UDP-3-O-acyl-N-acetylglucosamine deacetylase [Kiritimatiellia bacterium]
MTDQSGRIILAGVEDDVHRLHDEFESIPVDQSIMGGMTATHERNETTLSRAVSVTGPGTFFGRAQRTLTFEPTTAKGWWFDRTDIPSSLPIHVSVYNVWTVVRNIVLHSGSQHNYMRMVEHIIALKLGMGLDNVMIRMDSGDPPLFDRSSMDIVEAIEDGGIVSCDCPAEYFTVKQPVTITGSHGDFLTFLPAASGSTDLVIDCAINFQSAIGKQRIRFLVNNETFWKGAMARTNTTRGMMLYCKTVGKVFADVRNLGYTNKNILIAGPRTYINEPYLLHNGKSLEAVWHRATLDLLAAVALMDRGRFAGTILSYKAGHALDVKMMTELYRHDLLERV